MSRTNVVHARNIVSGKARTLAEVTACKPVKDQYTRDKPQDGKLSKPCQQGKCSQCYVLSCSCKCHGRQEC